VGMGIEIPSPRQPCKILRIGHGPVVSLADRDGPRYRLENNFTDIKRVGDRVKETYNNFTQNESVKACSQQMN